MTDTVLDRAALAVLRELFDGKDYTFDDVSNWTEEHAYDIALAVLLAIRGMDGHGIELAHWSASVVDAIRKEARK